MKKKKKKKRNIESEGKRTYRNKHVLAHRIFYVCDVEHRLIKSVGRGKNVKYKTHTHIHI